MATSKQEIAQWFEEGKDKNATHMVVVCDTYDYEDYPVFAYSAEEARKKEQQYNFGDNMQRVMEVYNLNQDKDEQLNQRRARNF